MAPIVTLFEGGASRSIFVVNAPLIQHPYRNAASGEPHPAMTAEQNAAIAAAIAAAPLAANPSAMPIAATRQAMLDEAESVVAFWREAGRERWFKKDPEFDRDFRERFIALHETAARGERLGWLATPEGALALILLLDQFPRNAFRGTTRMYRTDTLAREIADATIIAAYDLGIEPELRPFCYLPLGHSENILDQERSVRLNRPLGYPTLKHAEGHYDIIRRFGRFPHRNPILGRTMREEEQRFLDEGGFSG